MKEPAISMKYEASLKYYRDLKNVVDTSYEEGKAEGIAVGKAEGIAVGKLEIARQMKSDGESLDKIMRYTGLSAQEIENLQ